MLIDTGGIAEDATNQPEEVTSRMTNQALLAIDECDLVLFMLDARAGLLPGDYKVAVLVKSAPLSQIRLMVLIQRQQVLSSTL